MKRVSTPLTSRTLADPEPTQEWRPGQRATVPTYTDADDMTTFVLRYGVRNEANDGFDLLDWMVFAQCPYDNPGPAAPENWVDTLHRWDAVVHEVAARTGELPTVCAARLRLVVRTEFDKTGIVVPPEALSLPEVDITLPGGDEKWLREQGDFSD